VYIPSLCSFPNSFVAGKTAANLVAILPASKTKKTTGEATSAGTETNEPARMK
jgi:hypothetical protein